MTEEQRTQPYPPYEDEIELIDILRVLWRWKWFIVLLTAAVVIITALAMNMRYPSRNGRSAILLLSFPGVEKGQYPDGSVFSADKLITPLIVNQALGQVDGIDKNRFLANWRNVVRVQAVVPEEIKEEEAFYPSKFQLSVFFQTDEGEVVFTEPDLVNDFLLALVEVYKDRFEKRYVETYLVPETILIADLNPMEALDVIRQKAAHLHSAISGLSNEALRYKSKDQNRSLQNISQELKIFREIRLKNASARVLEHFYNDTFVEKYKQLTRQIEKTQAESSAARGMLNRLMHEENEKQAEGVIMDSQALEHYSRMDVRKYLVEKAIKAEIQASHLKVDLESLRSEQKSAENAASSGLVLKLQNQMTQMAAQANTVYAEYRHDQLDGTIRRISDLETTVQRAVNLKLIILLAGLGALMGTVFLSFFLEYIRSAAQR